MTPKEIRLNYKAKKLTHEADPANAKAKAEFLAAKKEHDALIAAVENPKAAPKAASNPSTKEPKAAEPTALSTDTKTSAEEQEKSEEETKKNPPLS